MTAKDNIIKYYEEGVDIKEISEKTKCSISYVYRVLRENSIKLALKLIDEKCVDLLKNTDKSFYTISRELEISERRVREIAYRDELREKKKSIW